MSIEVTSVTEGDLKTNNLDQIRRLVRKPGVAVFFYTDFCAYIETTKKLALQTLDSLECDGKRFNATLKPPYISPAGRIIGREMLFINCYRGA